MSLNVGHTRSEKLLGGGRMNFKRTTILFIIITAGMGLYRYTFNSSPERGPSSLVYTEKEIVQHNVYNKKHAVPIGDPIPIGPEEVGITTPTEHPRHNHFQIITNKKRVYDEEKMKEVAQSANIEEVEL